ncbi:MAG: tripartite tricarboxylate transporter substrate binding protein [Deltaproteobacteria bacterium]|nr:tripartite tricarboxylate transporter substrate binding protein [Deltaproteobacteria bacterium]
MKNFRLILVLSMVLIMAGGTGAQAEYPEKPLRLIVPWKAGGGTDSLFRIVAHYAGKYLGQPMVIVNVPGVGGTLGARQGKDSKPDGYTLTATHESVISSYLTGVSEFNYSDFIPIANLAVNPIVVSAKWDAPWKNMADLAADAKKRPGQIKYGVTLGSTSHFYALGIAHKAGIQFKIVGYEGTAPRRAALLGGFIDLTDNSPGAIRKYAAAKKMRGLGITAEKRHHLCPDVPTLKEQGIDAVFGTNRGVCAPLGTPQPIIEKLAKAFKQVSEDPEFLKKLEGIGSTVKYLGPQEYKAYIKEATDLYTKLAKEFGLYKIKK